MSRVSETIRSIREAKPFPKQRAPRVLQFPVTNLCDARCLMCDIWRCKCGYELTPDDVRKSLSNPLFKTIEYVGINGGEPTLRRDLPEVVRSIMDSLPALKSVSMITNGVRHNRVNEAIGKVAKLCHIRGMPFSVMVSLDGIEEIHDRIRGREGSFDSAVKVLEYLSAQPKISGFSVACTVTGGNVFGLETLLNWCQEKGYSISFRKAVPHRRLCKDAGDPVFNLDIEERFHFLNFLDCLDKYYETSELKREFYRSLRRQIAYGANRTAGCPWRYAGVTLLSNGDILYCAVESDVIGNVLKDDAQACYWGHSGHLRKIFISKCPVCLHDYNAPASRVLVMRHLFRRLVQRSGPRTGRLLLASARRFLGMLSAMRESARIRAATKGLGAANSAPAAAGRGGSVLICGWYGTETLGDKAILAGVMQAIHAARPDIVVDVASLEPYVTEFTCHQMPDLQVRKVMDLTQAAEGIRQGQYQAVVIGGGPLMSDIGQVVDLLELFALAKRTNTRTAIAGCGVKPQGIARDKVVRRLLDLADSVVVRDQQSLELARRELGYDDPAEATVDPAFLWVSNKMTDLAVERKNQIVLALRDWPIEGYIRDMTMSQTVKAKDRFEQEVLRFVDRIREIDADAEVIPFCMHKLAAGGDDRFFYARLFAGRREILDRLDYRHRRPVEDLCVLAESRAVLAMRFHSIVLSLGTRTPFLALDYTCGGKVAGLLSDLKMHNRFVPITEFDGCDAAERILETGGETPDLTEHVENARRVYRDMFVRLLGD